LFAFFLQSSHCIDFLAVGCGAVNDSSLTCTDFAIITQIYTPKGTDTSGLGDKLLGSIEDACNDIKSLQGVDTAYDPCSSILVVDQEGTIYGNGLILQSTAPSAAPSAVPTEGGAVVAGIMTTETSNDGMSVAGIVSLILCGMLLALFSIFFVSRRRRDDYTHKHHELRDDPMSEDDTYVQSERGTTKGSPESLFDPDASPRIMQGDDDSMSHHSGLYGYHGTSPDRDDTLAGYRYGQDVHICASATCHVCDMRRHAGPGLQFIPTDSPSQSHESLPENAHRSYDVRDTVEL
jgi:hypothetical protein